MFVWKKTIFVNAIKTRMKDEGRTAEDLIQEYIKLSDDEKIEILAEI